MRIILFDLMDTVVVDPYHRLGELLNNYDLSSEEFQEHRNPDIFIEFEEGRISERSFFKSYYRPGHESNGRLPRPQLIKKHLLKQVGYTTGMEELLVGLRKRNDLLMGLASNYSEWYREIFKRKPGLADFFDYHFFSCEMGVRKPEPEYYRIIAAGLKKAVGSLSPEQILFIDDRNNNLAPAAELGWQVHRMENSENLSNILTAFLE